MCESRGSLAHTQASRAALHTQLSLFVSFFIHYFWFSMIFFFFGLMQIEGWMGRWKNRQGKMIDG